MLISHDLVLRRILKVFTHDSLEVFKLSHLQRLLSLKRVFALSNSSQPFDESEQADMVVDVLEQIECLSAVVGGADERVVDAARLIEALEAFGYRDLERPRSKPYMNFQGLDLRGIRVMNRIAERISRAVMMRVKRMQNAQG
jgi:3-deoxy-D-arabino-heptulosonate 7-phosphate (DAHP) synthase